VTIRPLYWNSLAAQSPPALVTGDEAAIEQLVPGLRQQHWLEGNRTVLIYGGSLHRSLTRKNTRAAQAAPRPSSGRDCAGDAVVSHPDAADKRERPARAGKISELLGYAAPVWLWKLCDSEWPQADRAVQAALPVARH
jgi:type VI secretion system protein ImpL